MMITCQCCLCVNHDLAPGLGLMSSVGFLHPLHINTADCCGFFMDRSQTPAVPLPSHLPSLTVKESQRTNDVMQFPFIQRDN